MHGFGIQILGAALRCLTTRCGYRATRLHLRCRGDGILGPIGNTQIRTLSVESLEMWTPRITPTPPIQASVYVEASAHSLLMHLFRYFSGTADEFYAFIGVNATERASLDARRSAAISSLKG